VSIVISIASGGAICARLLHGDVSHACAAVLTILRGLVLTKLALQAIAVTTGTAKAARRSPSRCSPLVTLMCSPTAYMKSV